jgi:hypothetical protein
VKDWVAKGQSCCGRHHFHPANDFFSRDGPRAVFEQERKFEVSDKLEGIGNQFAPNQDANALSRSCARPEGWENPPGELREEEKTRLA